MNEQKSGNIQNCKVGLWKSSIEYEISIEYELNIKQKYYHDLKKRLILFSIIRFIIFLISLSNRPTEVRGFE